MPCGVSQKHSLTGSLPISFAPGRLGCLKRDKGRRKELYVDLPEAERQLTSYPGAIAVLWTVSKVAWKMPSTALFWLAPDVVEGPRIRRRHLPVWRTAE
jgi:hypothetical protein